MSRLKRTISLIAVATTVADAVAVLLTDCWALPVAVITAAGLVAAAAYSYSAAADAIEKVKIMLEAFRNNDFSFRLQERKNPEITESLGGISKIIKAQKVSAQQKEKFYGLILGNVKTGIFTLDADGNVELCNAAALRLLGLPVLTNAVQLDRVDPELRKSFCNMTVGETMLLTLSKTSVSVNLSKIDLAGKTLSIYMLNDVYSVIDRQEVEAWIKLTRVLTHEIMNGIAPIQAMSDGLLHGGISDPKRIEEGLGIISSTSEGLMKFTRSFRKFAAIPNPELSLNYVSELVAEAVTLMKEQLARTAVTTDIEPGDLIVQSDKNLICQVLVNLLKNAAEAGATKIRISSRTVENESVIIDVTDNGPQIPDDYAKQIFVPFFTTKSNGSGIGLSVSRRIMNMHGGTLQLISHPASKTFRLQFP